MNESINVVEAKANFSELMARVAYQRQRIIVERHGKPMMAWISLEDLARLDEVNDLNQMKQQRENALALANEIRARIRQERNGMPLPDSSELLIDMREGRMEE
jgi:prevent-host-death family protein